MTKASGKLVMSPHVNSRPSFLRLRPGKDFKGMVSTEDIPFKDKDLVLEILATVDLKDSLVLMIQEEMAGWDAQMIES